MLWVDGAQDENSGRADFPIMANAAKHGMPNLYMLAEPEGGLAGVTNVPLSIGIHGSDAEATLWLPSHDVTQTIGAVPVDGYVLSPDGSLWRLFNGQPFHQNTRWFGWVRSFDPFVDLSVAGTNPPPNEVIVNYTQRQFIWMLDWFIREKSIDPLRVSLFGHSAGSGGVNHLARTFPDRFSTATLFNNGQRYFGEAHLIAMQGDDVLNLPTTLTNRFGAVRLLDLFPLNTRLSSARDLPLFRIYPGKCDDRGVMHWGPDMLDVLREADRLGWGQHFYWDLRKHGINNWLDYWANAANKLAQTRRDDAAYQSRYRANQSFPAFYNLQNYSNHGDPGPGDVGSTNVLAACVSTNAWNGDDHGTWGGYFDWDTDTVIDTPTNWQATLFLVNNSAAAVDDSPFGFLRADVAIRKPQQFHPLTGSLVRWEIYNFTNGNLLAAGTNTVGAEHLVTVPGVFVPRDPARVRLNLVPIPPAPPYSPILYIAKTSDPASLDLYWFASSNHSYYIEQTITLTNWSPINWPIPAPAVDGWVTNTIANSRSNLFFRLRSDQLTNSPVPTVAGVYSLDIGHDGLARTYRLNIPATYNPAVPAPLVFMLHGGGQTANEIAAMHSALAHHANTNGMILVMPQSAHNERQTAWFNEDPIPGEPYVNDVSFILGLIDHLDASLNIDRTRVYSAGFSSGGIMTHYLGARTTNVFAALAAVGASIASERRNSGVVTTNPPAAGPMPVLIVNSTNDCQRTYYGGYNSSSNYIPPAITAAYYWTNANLCAGAPLMTTNNVMTQNIFRFEACDSKPPPGMLQPNQVTRMHWQTCAPNAEVIFITLTDGGHLWPDASDNVGFDANLAVIEFFKRH